MKQEEEPVLIMDGMDDELMMDRHYPTILSISVNAPGHASFRASRQPCLSPLLPCTGLPWHGHELPETRVVSNVSDKTPRYGTRCNKWLLTRQGGRRVSAVGVSELFCMDSVRSRGIRSDLTSSARQRHPAAAEELFKTNERPPCILQAVTSVLLNQRDAWPCHTGKRRCI